MAEIIRYTGSGEWSALYVDGKLVKAGDHYLVEDKIAEILGVTEVQSDDFLRGGGGYSDIAETLDDINEYRSEREAKLAEAERLRAEAARLTEQANLLTVEANSSEN